MEIGDITWSKINCQQSENFFSTIKHNEKPCEVATDIIDPLGRSLKLKASFWDCLLYIKLIIGKYFNTLSSLMNVKAMSGFEIVKFLKEILILIKWLAWFYFRRFFVKFYIQEDTLPTYFGDSSIDVSALVWNIFSNR